MLHTCILFEMEHAPGLLPFVWESAPVINAKKWKLTRKDVEFGNSDGMAINCALLVADQEVSALARNGLLKPHKVENINLLLLSVQVRHRMRSSKATKTSLRVHSDFATKSKVEILPRPSLFASAWQI